MGLSESKATTPYESVPEASAEVPHKLPPQKVVVFSKEVQGWSDITSDITCDGHYERHHDYRMNLGFMRVSNVIMVWVPVPDTDDRYAYVSYGISNIKSSTLYCEYPSAEIEAGCEHCTVTSRGNEVVVDTDSLTIHAIIRVTLDGYNDYGDKFATYTFTIRHKFYDDIYTAHDTKLSITPRRDRPTKGG